MKIIEFKEGQCGGNWLKWRNLGIGASDIPVIIGSNPYKTPLQLWEEKCGFRAKENINAAMAYGIRSEDGVRQLINDQYNYNLKAICIEDDNESFMKASLDGYDEDKNILVEIKSPISEKTIEKARERNIIHEYWLDQVQWQLMLTSAKKAYIAIWDGQKEDCFLREVLKDEAKQNLMKEKARIFWNQIINGIAPDPSDKDYIEVEDNDLKIHLDEYLKADQREKEFTKRKKKLKEKIIEFGDDGNFIAYGFKIKRCTASATYDINKMKKDGIDIEKYKKLSKSIGYYKIMLPKNKDL